MMVPKGTTHMAQTATSNEGIREWRQQSTEIKTWSHFNIFFDKAHQYQITEANTTGKGGYTMFLHNIYGVTTPPLEEHHKVLYSLQNCARDSEPDM